MMHATGRAAVTAADVMTSDLVTVRDDMTVTDLARFLVDREISGAPVVDADGDLIGVISLTDVARATGDEGTVTVDHAADSAFWRGHMEDPGILGGWEEHYDESDLDRLRVEGRGARVRDLMSTMVYSVSAETPVAEIARAMVQGHYHRVLVTRDGRLVGIVSSLDLVGLLAEG